MFNRKELDVISRALVVQLKSVERLSAKEGQPETVALEYKKVAGEIVSLLRKVNDEIVSASQVKK